MWIYNLIYSHLPVWCVYKKREPTIHNLAIKRAFTSFHEVFKYFYCPVRLHWKLFIFLVLQLHVKFNYWLLALFAFIFVCAFKRNGKNHKNLFADNPKIYCLHINERETFLSSASASHEEMIKIISLRLNSTAGPRSSSTLFFLLSCFCHPKRLQIGYRELSWFSSLSKNNCLELRFIKFCLFKPWDRITDWLSGWYRDFHPRLLIHCQPSSFVGNETMRRFIFIKHQQVSLLFASNQVCLSSWITF